MHRILYSKYKKADLNNAMTKKCQHSSKREREILLTILMRFRDIFNGKLGTWNTTPVDLELMGDVKPVCSQPYPVPRVHEEMFKQ